MGVELSSLVALHDVHLGQVSETGDLDVEGRLDEVDLVCAMKEKKKRQLG